MAAIIGAVNPSFLDINLIFINFYYNSLENKVALFLLQLLFMLITHFLYFKLFSDCYTVYLSVSKR